jgi:hypothetical protein
MSLIADIPVAMAAGVTAIIAHGLTSLGLPIAPTNIVPDRNTGIVVVSADATNVTYRNDGNGSEIAVFRVMHIHSVQAPDALALFGWKGGSGSGNGQQGSVRQQGSQGGSIPYTDATAPAAVTVATIAIPAGILNVTGRTLRVRASGQSIGTTGETCSHSVFFGGVLLATLPAVAPGGGSVPWLIDFEARNNGAGLLSVSRILKSWPAAAVVTVQSQSALAAPDLTLMQNLDLGIAFAGPPAGDSGALDLFTADIGG